MYFIYRLNFMWTIDPFNKISLYQKIEMLVIYLKLCKKKEADINFWHTLFNVF